MCNNNGEIFVVGIGPGSINKMTLEAIDCIKKCDVIIGYKVYINLIKDLVTDKELISSGMRKEIERCKLVVDTALEGKKVALISSGDSGVYGMAGPLLELIHQNKINIKMSVIPGITSDTATSALLGAPMMHDTARISLSNCLTPWEIIAKRLDLAAQGDFIITLYNPRSKSRPDNIIKARDILLKHIDPKTPVGIVKNVDREGQEIILTNLKELPIEQIDMFCTIIIGNSKTYIIDNKMITPRGYIL